MKTRKRIKSLTAALSPGINSYALTALEFGYKACEAGYNIQETISRFKRMIREADREFAERVQR